MTHVDPANAHELAAIPQEIGVPTFGWPEVLTGHLHYAAASGGWQLGDTDLSEYLAQHRDRRLILILALVSDAEPLQYICGICGFAMDEAGECPRCRLQVQAQAQEMVDTGEDRDVLDQVRDWLDGADAAPQD